MKDGPTEQAALEEKAKANVELLQEARKLFHTQFSLTNELYLHDGLEAEVAATLAKFQPNIEKLEKFRASFHTAVAQHLSSVEHQEQDSMEGTSDTSRASASSASSTAVSTTFATATALFKACVDISDEPTSKINIDLVKAKLIDLFDKATVFVPLMAVELNEFDPTQMANYLQDNIDLLLGRLQSKCVNFWTKGKKMRSYQEFCTKAQKETEQKIEQLHQTAGENKDSQKYEYLKVFLHKLSEFGKKEFAEARKPFTLFP